MLSLDLAITSMAPKRATPVTLPPALLLDAFSGVGGSLVSSLTVSHVVGVSSGYTILVACIGHMDPLSIGSNVSGVTFAGQALTLLTGSYKTNGFAEVEIWYLLNPPAVTDNVVATFTGMIHATLGCTSWDGVNQGVPFGTPVLGGTTSAAPSVTVTVAVGNALVSNVFSNNTTTNVSGAGVGNNATYFVQSLGSSPNRCRGMLAFDEVDTGSVAASFTLTASKAWAEVAVEIRAA